jgi:hypothetical protein
MNEPARARSPMATVWMAAAVMTGGLAAALLWSGALSSPERLLDRSFGPALAAAETGTGALRLTPASMMGSQDRAADSIWSGAANGSNLALRRPVALGDQITISSGAKRPEKMSVVQIDSLDGAAIGAPGTRFQLVTAKVEGATDSSLVRLLVAIDPANSVSNTDKTL